MMPLVIKEKNATYQWARDHRVDLTMNSISQVIHNCETCAAIKQAKRVKPLRYGGRWLKYSDDFGNFFDISFDSPEGSVKAPLGSEVEMFLVYRVKFCITSNENE
ncbi:hypothetical protein HGM15179_020635 [Zosterops borbonicus]|uniref:Integrase zinc-binding domain-containing protein n=1 Tax=Zosterops borbonicus TaxID=364589 RepID=A0A8K1FWV4_9PASS|nr:hypothetical protein HGM15179_020635 [Zosterops borbonicus]